MKIRTTGVAWQEIDGELVILDLNSSKYLKTNKAGAFLTKLLQVEQDEAELSAALADEFRIDEETAHRDTAAFIASLRNLGLLASP